ncbi:MAG: DUF5691 domain-containing protein [Chloroflexota bacterium]
MWNDLLTTALVGTERRALDLDNLPEAFRELAAQLDGQDSEQTLLALAGALTLHRRVGQTAPINDAPPLEPCDLNDLPSCSPRAGLILRQIVALSQHTRHLQEWVTAAVAAGQRVSDEYLSIFLTHLNRSVLPEHFYEVLGKRGRWLAQHNEGWAYAILPQNDAEWENASFPARLAYVRQLRVSDPAHGLALIETIWKQGKSINRVQILDLLDIGLNSGDEPFLEALLGERSTGFHSRSAAWYLAKLPTSAFSQRMSARAETSVHIGWKKQRLSKKLVIDVTLPETWDESMGHDGIENNPSATGSFDLPTYWLFSLVQNLSSAYWLGGDWSADELVQAASEHKDWRKMLIGALAKTVEREHNNNLASALLEVDLDIQDETLALSGASSATREAFALYTLEQAAKSGGSIVKAVNLLARFREFEHMWSRNFTHAFITALARLLPGMSVIDLTALITQMSTFALRMSPDYAEELRALAEVENKSKSSWSRAVKVTASTLEYRRNIHKEFAR